LLIRACPLGFFVVAHPAFEPLLNFTGVLPLLRLLAQLLGLLRLLLRLLAKFLGLLLVLLLVGLVLGLVRLLLLLERFFLQLLCLLLDCQRLAFGRHLAALAHPRLGLA